MSRWILVCAAISLAACSKDHDAASGASATATAVNSSVHASTTAKPGSHDDWCEEHQVPESKCTQCNAKLIPAFQATGDWCEEHQLPESQCKKCHPELKIERPAEGT